MERGRSESLSWSPQICVVHFERIVDRIIPKRKRTPEQNELKEIVRRVLYAESEAGSRGAMDELLLARRKRYFRDRKSLSIIRSLESNFDLLTTHFRIPTYVRSNNVAESVNDKMEMRLKMIRGYKRVRTATNSLKLIVTHYRFKPFASCKKKENNGKSPLNLAGVSTSKLNLFAERSKRAQTPIV
jgi:transposase-like protein